MGLRNMLGMRNEVEREAEIDIILARHLKVLEKQLEPMKRIEPAFERDYFAEWDDPSLLNQQEERDDLIEALRQDEEALLRKGTSGANMNRVISSKPKTMGRAV